MADDSFQAGDVVQLKSGGPRMTVVATGNGNASCTWFDEKKQCNGNFPLAGLKPVKDDGPPKALVF